jgi:hypothetical protein
MRHVLGFISFVALAVIAAGALGVAGLGPLSQQGGAHAAAGDFSLDYRSLLAGTVLGVALSSVSRWSWADMPRRVIAWIYANERRLFRCAWAGLFLAVLLFY